MPSRAFLLFGLFELAKRSRSRRSSFNALAGIFAFRTLAAAANMNKTTNGFNALAGIFAFRTKPPPRAGNGSPPIVSMPSRAFLLFGRDP